MKMLSVNLWYNKYSSKTNMQLQSYRKLGFCTHLFTIIKQDNTLHAQIHDVTETDSSLIYDLEYSAYFKPFVYYSIFKDLSRYISSYDFIYIRRLMSKIFFIVPFMQEINKNTKVIYEFPTFPFDKNVSVIYKIRDFFELRSYNLIRKYVDLTLAIPTDHKKINKEWLCISNYIDISEFMLPPKMYTTSTIHFLIVANMARWHGYKRFLESMRNYNGENKIMLTVVSAETPDYIIFKETVQQYNLSNSVTCLPQMNLSQIQEIASDCHIGVGFLSDSSSGIKEISSLKHRDYAAMGLPFFTTINDFSFKDKCPYYYKIENPDVQINLDVIIDWFLDISVDPNYKIKMYEYARDNLQYYNVAKEIVARLSI